MIEHLEGVDPEDVELLLDAGANAIPSEEEAEGYAAGLAMPESSVPFWRYCLDEGEKGREEYERTGGAWRPETFARYKSELEEVFAQAVVAGFDSDPVVPTAIALHALGWPPCDFMRPYLQGILDGIAARLSLGSDT